MSTASYLFLLLKFVTISLFFATCLSKMIHVDITNRLPTNETPLTVYCKNLDNDLGYHNLSTNQLFAWSFNDSILKVRFYCRFWHEKNYAIFMVFGRNSLCIDNIPFEEESITCYYEARVDGFYFSKTNTTNSWEKVHDWF